jgi:5-methylcytosine-specific restriction endonuclease McrA
MSRHSRLCSYRSYRSFVSLLMRHQRVAAMKPCKMCDADMVPRSRTQVFCSRSCAASYRQAVRPHRSGAKRWAGKDPEAQAAYGSAYRRARDSVVAAALGSVCPGGCGRVLTVANCQADHVVPRAAGGCSSVGNLRAVCESCNRLRGASLGGRVTKARRAARERR